MTEKRKTLTVKKAVEKVVDAVKEIGEQPMQEQALVQGKIPQEQKADVKSETKAEPKAQPQSEQKDKEKNKGIDLVNKDGVNVESKDGKIFVTYPNRKDIDYTMTKATGMDFEKIGYADAQDNDKLYPKEKLQVRTIAFNSTELNPDTIGKLSSAIEKARTTNLEYRAERNAAWDYFKEVAGSKEAKVFGKPFVIHENDDNSKEVKPSYFNGDIVKVGKHLIAAVEGATDKAVYLRLIETNTLPLAAQDYADKQKAARNHLGIKDENIVTSTVNGKEQELIKDVKRHIAYSSDWEISKVAPYEQKPAKKKAQTMAM